jgi:ubiquinone/menaquinone biosynthesis C-methylase UbiE
MEQLEALLRCPECGSEVELDELAVCVGGVHRYPIVERIPVFLDDNTIASNPQYAGQRAYFDSEYRSYGRYSLENWRIGYLDRLREAGVLESSGPPLVDVGVGGSGYTVIEAARTGRRAIGCDLSLEGLLVARRLAEAEGVAERTLWVCCSAERLPLASSSVGSALAIAVLEHVPDDQAALRELGRVLQPGGRAWVTVPHALRNISPVFRLPNRRHDRRLGHLRRYEAETLIQTARASGLEPVDVQFTGHAIKVVQFAAQRLGDRLWWWCESRDRRRRDVRRGSMQLSVVFARA